MLTIGRRLLFTAILELKHINQHLKSKHLYMKMAAIGGAAVAISQWMTSTQLDSLPMLLVQTGTKPAPQLEAAVN